MFYLLLLTDSLLCLTDNTFLPIEFKNLMNHIRIFDSYDEAEFFIHKTLGFDDMWDFGLSEPGARIILGKVYCR